MKNKCENCKKAYYPPYPHDEKICCSRHIKKFFKNYCIGFVEGTPKKY